MCIELYSPDQKIEILYEQEVVQFISPTSFIGRYMVLVHNPGPLPLRRLLLMYPRYLMETTKLTVSGVKYIEVTFRPVRLLSNLPIQVRSHQPLTRTGNRVSMAMADPNDPAQDFPLDLSGEWCGTGSQPTYSLPGGVQNIAHAYTNFCRDHGISAWEMTLPTPLPAGGSHWFYWEIRVDDAGVIVPDSVAGPMVFHELASPLNVRRTIAERLDSECREARRQIAAAAARKDPTVERAAKKDLADRELIIRELGLKKPRQVTVITTS